MKKNLCGCHAPKDEQQHFFAMDTVMTLRLIDASPEDFKACQEKVKELEQKFSVTLPESEISALNRAGSATLSADGAAVVEAGLTVSEQTEGAFCLSLYPAGRLWGFSGEEMRVPSAQELEAVRPLIGDEAITLSEKEITLPKGGAIDLGGIAKGYTADLLDLLLEERQVEHFFLSLGGNVQVGGGNPDGSPWRVGIADPDGGEAVGVLEIADGAVVTSGGYQRNFEQDGTLYHHILDPETLAPAKSGLKSATAVGLSGTLADALSTAFFVMGEERALDYCARYDAECILITEDDRVVVSPGLKEQFTLLNPQYRYEK